MLNSETRYIFFGDHIKNVANGQKKISPKKNLAALKFLGMAARGDCVLVQRARFGQLLALRVFFD